MATGKREFQIYHFIIIFCIIAVSIGTAGYFYYRNQKEDIKRDGQDAISAIADLKVEQITNWRKERISDASFIFNNPAIAEQVEALQRDPSSPRLKKEILKWMGAMYKNRQYDLLCLLSVEGKVLLSVPEDPSPLRPQLKAHISEAFHTKRLLFSDFYRDENQNIFLDMAIPILGKQRNEDKPAGAVILRIDPRTVLYPIIQVWPTAGKTAETLLIRREGDSFLYLNELRYRKNIDLTLRFPVNEKKSVSAMAARGRTGIVDGIDYRGIPVLAAVRPVPDSPWLMVAKIDRDEIFAPYMNLKLVMVLIVLLISLAGLSIILLWRHQRVNFYARQYEMEHKQRELLQKYEYLTRYANDIILLVNREGEILDANERAMTAYGYNHEELLALNIRDLQAPEARLALDIQINQEEKKDGLVFETVHRQKDGKTFPVEVSSRPIEIDGGKIYQNIIRDITERKLAEKELEESKDFLNKIINAISDPIFVKDRDHRMILANEAFCELTGWKCEEILGRSDSDFFPKEQVDVFWEKDELVLQTGEENINEEYVSDFRGNVHVTVTKKTLYEDSAGNKFIVGIIRDVTERKQAEEALRESEMKFRGLFDSMAEGVALHEMIYDDDGNAVDYRIVMTNPAYEKYTGIVSEKAIGRVASELYGTDTPPFMDLYSRVAGTGESSAFAAYFGPMEKFFNISVFSPKRGWFATVFEDITERKKTDEALRENEQRFREITDTAIDVIITVDTQGTIVLCNRAVEKTLGYSDGELIGKNINILVPQRYRKNHEEGLKKYLLTGESHHLGRIREFSALKKDATEFPIELSLSTWKTDKNIYFTGIIRDISDRKKLEAQLLQSQKVEAIGQLAGGIAHDFNNILTAIIGYAHMLKIKMTEDALLRTYAEHILSLSNRAANLTQSLLAFSRKQIINPKPVNLNEIISTVDKLLSRIIGEDIQLKTMLSEGDLIIMADHVQIEQVLMNLAANARDAMPDGGFLNIKTETCDMDSGFITKHGYGKAGKYALISVTDTGMGMDRKTREKIFEPFFTTKEVGKGTGLGLSMVYGTIKQHDGYINVYSEPGKGTTFRIYLPLLQGKAGTEAPAPEMVQPLETGTETVLLAEDEIEVRVFTRKLLADYGYRVIEAIDGEDAVEKFKLHGDKIQLVILDVIMPKKNGREAYDEIKAMRPDVKVLFTSGYTADIIHKHGIVESGFAFIDKPASPVRLLKKIREILDA